MLARYTANGQEDYYYLVKKVLQEFVHKELKINFVIGVFEIQLFCASLKKKKKKNT